jgi:hypothetical protein
VQWVIGSVGLLEVSVGVWPAHKSSPEESRLLSSTHAYSSGLGKVCSTLKNRVKRSFRRVSSISGIPDPSWICVSNGLCPIFSAPAFRTYLNDLHRLWSLFVHEAHWRLAPCTWSSHKQMISQIFSALLHSPTFCPFHLSLYKFLVNPRLTFMIASSSWKWIEDVYCIAFNRIQLYGSVIRQEWS